MIFLKTSYLEKYGYLKLSNRGFGAVRSPLQLTEAIKDLQYNMNLEETGVMDDATKEIMTRPRCGMQDPKRGQRNKRFTIFGVKWPKTHLTWR